MTGAVLVHKELVPNYGLLSSIQEAATRASAESKPGPVKKVEGDAAPVAPVDSLTDTIETAEDQPELVEQDETSPDTQA
jgi:hypothetical protein